MTTDDPPEERVRQRDEFAAALTEQGIADVLVLRREVGHEVLNDDRLTILQHLNRNDAVKSVTYLARRLNRGEDAVSQDLRRLAELDVIEFDGERPELKHDHVIIEPVIYG